MKKILKIFSIFIIILMLWLSTISFADTDFSGLSEVSTPSGVDGLVTPANKILGIIYVVAVSMSVGMLVIIGIRYVVSSPEQKADLKSKAIPYLIGAILVFGTANIVRFISTMAGWIKL